MNDQKKKISMGPYVDDNEIFAHRLHNGKLPTTVPDVAESQSIDDYIDYTQHTLKSKTNKTTQHYKMDTFSLNSESKGTNIPLHNDLHSQPEDVLNDQTRRIFIEMTKKKKSRNGRGRKTDLKLKEIISKQKVLNLRNKFINKIKRNNSHSQAVDFEGFKEEMDHSFLKREGFQPSQWLDNMVSFLSISHIVMLLVIFSMALVFVEVEEDYGHHWFQTFAIIFYFFEIIYNCTTVKSKSGRKLKSLEEIIMEYYKSTTLAVDAINLGILILDISFHHEYIHATRLFLLLKLPQCLEKMEKLEVSFIKNYHYEQYWSLVKVVLFNFCFAHVLAIFLTGMASMNPTNNWYQLPNIYESPWFEKYIWAYYWGVNIMLTVGFGDMYACNYQEALCLIFIEIFSVMCLAYNINWIGTLISNIRAQDLERGKNFKTFKQLSQKYVLPSQLEWRISNYIEESVNIKKKFNLEQERTFIESLPTTMKKDYLKESNKSIFHSLPFFSSLVDKTLYHFAEKIEMTISHPEQMLKRLEDDFNLLILRQGEIGYTAKRRNCHYNEMIIDRVKVNPNQRPFILGLEFLTRVRPIYETKSLEYSVVYSLSYDDMINILKESQMDYMHFCFLRDKSKSTLDEFEVFNCNICKNSEKHTKFTCPKIHYSPIHQIVIHKNNHREKNSKNPRVRTQQLRIQLPKCNSLGFNLKLKSNLNDIPGLIAIKTDPSKRKIHKLGNPFLDKLSMMKKLRESQMEEREERIEEWFVKNTSELIKQEFDRHFRIQTYEDEVWLLNCDKAKSYKDYFPQNNACGLEFTFCVDERQDFVTKNYQEKNRNVKIGSFTCFVQSSSGMDELDSYGGTSS